MKKIIVVDDEPKIRYLYRRSLDEFGYNVLEAVDGKKALKILGDNKDTALIILDIILPKMSGSDIFEAIKILSPQTKILVSSVYSVDDQEFLIWHADDYYYKSDGISVLVDKVNALLKNTV